ncbi:unnamed protein product [Phaeothamnion confervicola]
MSSKPKPVSRIGGVSEAAGDPILADIFAHILARRGHILNIHQVVAHSPKMLRAQAAYASSMREDSILPRDLQELLILRVAQVNGSEYEQSVHRPIALACGASLEKIEALPGWANSPAFDARERAALAFVDQGAGSGEIHDAAFAAAAELFSSREMVEIATLVAWYVGNSRFVRMMRIAPQDGAAS